jgi:hypothetical protein
MESPNVVDLETREESERSAGEKIRRLVLQNPIVHDAFQRVAKKREVRVDRLSSSGRTRALELALIGLAKRNEKQQKKLKEAYQTRGAGHIMDNEEKE